MSETAGTQQGAISAPEPAPSAGAGALFGRLGGRAARDGGRPPSRLSDGRQALAILVVTAGLLAWGLTASNPQLPIDVAMFITLAYSWNIISGFTGYISFGQVLFFGLGAIFTAELIIHAHWNWYLASAAGGLAAMLIALPVGAIMLRLRGIYFALGMFGLGYITELLLSQWSFAGGSTGLTIPGELALKPVLISMTVLALAALGLNLFMARSGFGVRAMSIRDDEQVASAMGVPTTRVKVLAFMLSALLPGMAGGVVAYNRAFIDTSTVFSPSIDLQVIVFVLAGGIGTLWGPLIGAAVLTVLSDQLVTRLPQYELAVFGALIILITLLLPGGIVSAFNRLGWLRRDIVKAPQRLPSTEELERILKHQAASAEPEEGREHPLLSCRDVGVQFGGVRALTGVDFAVSEGESVFIIGANGAGKTTLFNAITGMVRPTSGVIEFDGRPVRGATPHVLAARGLGRTFQIPRPFESMTVWENILVAALGGRMRRQATAQTAWAVRALELEDICFAPTSTLAVGHRRMVELARALALQPRLILLDEVMAGMTDEELERVRTAIRRMPSFGVGAVAGIEHVIKAIVDLADEIVVMDRGQRILGGPPREILAHPEVVRAYLGGPVSEETSA